MLRRRNCTGQWRSTLIVGVLAGAAVAVPANAAFRLPSRAVLTGTIVVSSSGTGYVPVRVAAPFHTPPWVGRTGTRPDLTVSDPRHFVALVLVAEHRNVHDTGNPQFPSATHAQLIVAAMPDGDGGQRYFYEWAGLRPFAARSPVVPAGRYRLYVVASAPERLTWHLPLGGGRQRLAATTPARANWIVNSSENVPGTSAKPALASAAGHFRTGPVAQVWRLLWIRGQDVGNFISDEAFCQYPGADAVAVAVNENVPGPVCDGINAILDTPDYAVPPSSQRQDIYLGGVTAIDHKYMNANLLPSPGFKTSALVSGQVDHAVVFELWLSLDGLD